MRVNPEDVAILMNAFATQMDTYLTDMVAGFQTEVAPGVVTTRGAVPREMNFIDEQIRSIDRYLGELDSRLQRREQALHSQFSQAEVAMSRLLQQAQWLASVTAQLQAQNNNNNF